MPIIAGSWWQSRRSKLRFELISVEDSAPKNVRKETFSYVKNKKAYCPFGLRRNESYVLLIGKNRQETDNHLLAIGSTELTRQIEKKTFKFIGNLRS